LAVGSLFVGLSLFGVVVKASSAMQGLSIWELLRRRQGPWRTTS
jgi:hypothetical protein